MSQVYFMVLADGGSAPEWLNETLQTTARPGAAMTLTTGADKCGSYQSDNMGSYSASAHFTAGTANEVTCAVVNSGDYRKDRIHTIIVPGSKPSPQVKLTEITLYQEAGESPDDGNCTESGLTYHKYVATVG